MTERWNAKSFHFVNLIFAAIESSCRLSLAIINKLKLKTFFVSNLTSFSEKMKSLSDASLATELTAAKISKDAGEALSTAASTSIGMASTSGSALSVPTMAIAGPALLMSFGLPLLGVWLAKNKHDSPLARKFASFLGAPVNKINVEFVVDQIQNKEYYRKLHTCVLEIINKQNISPLKDLLSLTEDEAMEVFYVIKEVVFSKEVLDQFSSFSDNLKNAEVHILSFRESFAKYIDSLTRPLLVSMDADNVLRKSTIMKKTPV